MEASYPEPGCFGRRLSVFLFRRGQRAGLQLIPHGEAGTQAPGRAGWWQALGGVQIIVWPFIYLKLPHTGYILVVLRGPRRQDLPHATRSASRKENRIGGRGGMLASRRLTTWANNYLTSLTVNQRANVPTFANYRAT